MRAMPRALHRHVIPSTSVPPGSQQTADDRDWRCPRLRAHGALLRGR